jgi:soluble lytic murein transglycosylase
MKLNIPIRSTEIATAVFALLAAAGSTTPAYAQDGSEWDRARAQLIASQRSSMGYAIQRWKLLTSSDRFSFGDYAGFLAANPGFPMEAKLRGYAEQALNRESPHPASIAAFFDRNPPLSNVARGRHAAALSALRRPEARAAGLAAWRGGSLAPASEAVLFSMYGAGLTPADHDARMNALLWAGDVGGASRQIAYVSPAARAPFMERLAMLQGSAPGSLGMPSSGNYLGDAGYVFNRVRLARRSGNMPEAVRLLATRPLARVPPLNTESWIAELLAVAKGADNASAVRIAASVDDAFPAGTDVSRESFRLRDDYTSLVWLGGTRALWNLGDAGRAAPLFYRYVAAAQTPPTRAKGFYWAGRASAQSGDQPRASRYFELAAAYPETFYGMLALERLGRPLPAFDNMPRRLPTAAERAAFNARPLTLAVREVARDSDWPTAVRFFREIADSAKSETDHVLVAELAREIGRRDLGVILGQAAHADGYGNFQRIAFPLVPVPPGTNWTMVHALARQESQFAQNAVSHAGARGLMQLMPGTAREQAGKIGLSYDAGSLISDRSYNIRLGDSYFARMMRYYSGCYPLAVGAYNAGPGNVNRWLAANGDPRHGRIDWVTWIERIPIYETRNYIQRVLENAVVYEAMNPAKASYRGANPLSYFLRKHTPG